MKKAIINQMFLGFLLISGLVTFVATINDEQLAKRKVYNLKDITDESMRALSNSYLIGMNSETINGEETTVARAICQAEDITKQLLEASSLGKELIDSDQIKFTWKDAGTYDPVNETYNGAADGLPDSITVEIEEQKSETFWYKFLEKDNFKIPETASAIDLNRFNYNVDISFRGVIEAGYYNMVGTYEEDSDGCPTNAELILADKKAWENRIGETLATIEMPQTKMFFISDGYRRFGDFNNGNNDQISLDTAIEFDCSGDYPTAILTTTDGDIERSDDSHNNLTSRANVYFDDTSLNFDKKTENGVEIEADHINEIAEKDWGAFVAYMEEEGDWNDEAKAYADNLTSTQKSTLAGLSGDYDGWLAYAAAEGIDFSFDPHGEYVFVSEDLAATTDPSDANLKHDYWASDHDFSDMSFSMKKLFIPEPVDLDDINSDADIIIDCSNI